MSDVKVKANEEKHKLMTVFETQRYQLNELITLNFEFLTKQNIF